MIAGADLPWPPVHDRAPSSSSMVAESTGHSPVPDTASTQPAAAAVGPGSTAEARSPAPQSPPLLPARDTPGHPLPRALTLTPDVPEAVGTPASAGAFVLSPGPGTCGCGLLPAGWSGAALCPRLCVGFSGWRGEGDSEGGGWGGVGWVWGWGVGLCVRVRVCSTRCCSGYCCCALLPCRPCSGQGGNHVC